MVVVDGGGSEERGEEGGWEKERGKRTLTC